MNHSSFQRIQWSHIVVLCILALGSIHCGSQNICDSIRKIDMEEKSKACKDDPGSSISFKSSDPSQCESNLEKCTAKDKEQLRGYVDCVRKIPSCKAGESKALIGRLLQCVAANPLSEACRKAL